MGSTSPPTVVVSKCLGFEPCRYNGQIIADELVARLRSHVTFIPICPELEIGLGAPRHPIRLVSVAGELRLIQPATQLDVTERMQEYACSFLDSVGEVEGFILKARSPSCGTRDVKVYPGVGKMGAISRAAGLFGRAVLERFAHLPIEDEGRLSNFAIREHFLTRLFTLSAFRSAKAAGAMNGLVRFHAEHKLLLMAYSQKELRALGRIVANPAHRPLAEVWAEYERHLHGALARAPRCSANINVLMHTLGYFSDQLSSAEKAYFLDSLEQFRARRIPLSASVGVVRAWIARFGNDYLRQQVYFSPYPEELVSVTDSGKGRAC